MKTKLTTFLFFMFIALSVQSQDVKIENIRYKKRGNKLIVKYQLINNISHKDKIRLGGSYIDEIYQSSVNKERLIPIGIQIKTFDNSNVTPIKIKGDIDLVDKFKKKNKIKCYFSKGSTLLTNNEFKITIYNKDNSNYAYSSIDKPINELNESKFPPILTIEDISFSDKNRNNCIDGNEDCSVSFKIDNKGKGLAKNLMIKIINKSDIQGLDFNSSVDLGNIPPNSSQKFNIPIKGNMNLSTGLAKINFSFKEELGFTPDPFELNIETKEFLKPLVKVVDYSFLTDNGFIKLGLPVQLKILVQNIGQGAADNVNISFEYPTSNVFPNGEKNFLINSLRPGESKELTFEFIANKLYSDKTIPITVTTNEKNNLFGENKKVFANVEGQSSGKTINITSNASSINRINIEVASLTSEVDKNIPVNPIKYSDRYALIIGNEDYSSRQTGLNSEVDVAFAVNDAKVFKEYCVNTFGVEEKNVFLLTNATSGEMYQRIELVSQILTKLGKQGELIFYYAGHGFPDENTKEPYLIPVDVSAANLSAAIKLYDVYKKLSQTGAKRITVFLDACFTGGGRESGLLAARGVKIKPKMENISGNMIIFAATSEEQSALPYTEKQHGMYTYYLLKKLQETKGDITYGILDDYLSKNVSIESLKINNKAQDPKTIVSSNVTGIWKNWKLK